MPGVRCFVQKFRILLSSVKDLEKGYREWGVNITERGFLNWCISRKGFCSIRRSFSSFGLCHLPPFPPFPLSFSFTFLDKRLDILLSSSSKDGHALLLFWNTFFLACVFRIRLRPERSILQLCRLFWVGVYVQ